MDKENVLKEYRNIVCKDSPKARDLIKKLDYKNDFYLLQCIAQTYLDESRFEDEGGSTLRLHIDKRKWRMAERYIIKAYNLNPENAEVLYTMGEIRKIYDDQVYIAIFCFEKIDTLDIKVIANGEYGRGIAFAKELVNDAKFELYRLYYEENPKLSKQYLAEYKRGLSRGITSIFKPLKKFLLN